MKIILTQEKLSKALATVGRVASSRTTLPILNNILIKTDGNNLVLSATNLEVAITTTIPAKIEKKGILTVPAKLLVESVAILPKVNVALEEVDGKLLITTDNYKSTINTTNADDFPEIPEIAAKTKLNVPADLFKKAVAGTAQVASSDATRPILTGVYIHSADKSLYFVATDGYRLAEKKLLPCSDEIAAIVPATTLNDVVRTLDDNADEVKIGFSDDQVSFAVGDSVITSRLIDGNFINYRQLIPTKTDVTAVVNRGELVRVTKISEIFARESAGSIVIKASAAASTLNIHSIASQIGENTAETEANIIGDGTVTLNSRFLLDGLNQLDGENVKMQFSGKLAPVLLTAENSDDYKHIIMPVKS